MQRRTMRRQVMFLLWWIPVSITAITFRQEAEFLLGVVDTIIARSRASSGHGIHVTETAKRLSFPFCLYRRFSNANVTVTYSNDGGEDTVRVKVDNTQNLIFTSVAESNYGENWNVFRSKVFYGVTLNRGYNLLTLVFEHLDGIEIDYVDVSIDDDFITDDVFRCKLVLGSEPRLTANRAPGLSAGYVEQRSYTTSCAEEDNVHLPVYHPKIQQYTLTATNPLYRTLYDNKTHDDSHCPHSNPVFWRFQDVNINVSGDVWYPTAPADNLNNATIIGVLLDSSQQSGDTDYDVMYTVSFSLKGVKTGFIDADIYTDMKAVFCQSDTTSTNPSVSISYVSRDGQEVALDTFDLEEKTVTKHWQVREMTWSENNRNTVTVNVTQRDVTVCKLELIRGYMGPDQDSLLYFSGVVLLQGFRSAFWWRRSVGEHLTVTVGNQRTSNLSRVAVYVPVPWTGANSYQQILVLNQDGNVRLVPLPYSSPYPEKWTPFGTSVIVGRSSPLDFRPAAGIRNVTFYPETMRMSLIYYDGSTCNLTLTYSIPETRLKVTDLNFASSTSGQPFATFRSMFVAFGQTDSDSVQSDREGPRHVLGPWKRLNGTEFMVFRAVESHHLTHSPDLRLTIQA